MNHLKPHSIHLHLGLERPVHLLHLTDAHVALADGRNEDMIDFAAETRRLFSKEAGYPDRDPIGFLQEAMAYSEGFDCTVITGDLVDFNTLAAYDAVGELLEGRDYLFCAGNHEFTPRPGIDSHERKRNTAEYVQSHFRGNMFLDSRIVGGVNIVSADNGYTVWTEAQLEGLKAEAAKGYPILLFTHAPLHAEMKEAGWFARNANIPGATPEMFETSARVIRYLAEEPLFAGFFSGHWHNTDVMDFDGKPGYILGALFKGIVGEITVD